MNLYDIFDPRAALDPTRFTGEEGARSLLAAAQQFPGGAAMLVLVLYLPWSSIDRRITSEVTPNSIPSCGSQRNLFVGAACGLILLHLFAVLSKREFEPLYSNYPMYAGELRAGTKAEAQFWRE